MLLFGFAGPVSGQVFDSDNVVLLANEDIYPGYNDVWGFVGSDAREYIIQGLTNGTAWWDVEDPANPVHVKWIPGPGSIWRDMFVIGDYAYVGTEGGGGIQIVDISDPTDPTLVTSYTTTVGASHNIFGDVARKLLYVVGAYQNTNNGGLQILDVANPIAPVEIAQWDNQYIHDISTEGMMGHVNLISAGRFRLLDLTTPGSPVATGSNWNDPNGSPHASWPIGDGVHVVMAEENGGGHIKILDVSNPSSIQIAATVNPFPSASMHNPHVEGTLAYCAWYAAGTRILDVSTPTAPFETGYLDTYPDSDGGGVGPGNWGTYPHLPSGTVASNDGTYGLFLFEYEPNAATLDGVVSSSGGGTLADATVEYTNLNNSMVTDGTGAYRFSAYPGAGNVIDFSSFGHAPQSINVNAVANGTTTTNVTLVLYPAGTISGTVTDANTALPIQGVELALVGTPLTATTDVNGDYSFSGVPTLPTDTYGLSYMRYGYKVPANASVTVVASSNTTKDLQLAPGAVFQDFATPTGWTVESDPATTTGFWEFGEPAGTYSSGIPFQPEFDHTLNPEDQCAVTGNTGGGLGDNDVDGGATRLLSPTYDLSSMNEPHAFWYRWYAVNDLNDEWQVHATDDGGSNWVLLESSPDHAAFWQGVVVNLTGLFTDYSQIQFRFTAEDPSPGQLVEAALDDFTIYDNSSGPTDVHLPDVNGRLRLELAQNFPNPFPTATKIRYSIPAREHVQISVFDVRGARVATLVDQEIDPGAHEVTWDGRNFTGRNAASGVYFYKLQTKSEIRTRKMLRVN
jgi:choice-of-anchor B domain-containing protein